jgi:hypothetical protein
MVEKLEIEERSLNIGILERLTGFGIATSHKVVPPSQ